MTQLAYEVNKQSQARPYFQFGGARPNIKPLYYGGETNYGIIGGASFPQRGGVEAQWTRSQYTTSGFDLIGSTETPPDLAEATITFREKIGTIPRHLLTVGCELNAYVLRGICTDLSVFNSGWSSYVQIFSRGLITDRSRNDENAWEDDEPNETELTAVFKGGIYPAGNIGFTERQGTTITVQVSDVTYANKTVCGECGPANDGTQWIYAIEQGAVAGDPIVHYSVDGGLTWATSTITPAANAEVPSAIRVMGNYLVVLSPTAQGATQGGYYYTTLNTVTGVPSSSWTMVTTGFANAQEPRDMVVLGPREAYIACDGGVILRVTDVPSGATSLGAVSANDLGRIHAAGDCIVAVGASATVVKSLNRGQSFIATTTSPGAATNTAVQVMDRNRFWVGNSSGAVYYTLDGGETAWSQKTLSVTPTAIQDIRFGTNEAGYIAYTLSSLGRLAWTLDGGYSWEHSQNVQPRLLGVNPAGTSQRYNRIAVPGVADPGINANYLSIAGLGATTDGALMVGAGNVF